MYQLSNTIRDYDWGSRTSMAQIFGREATGSPEAEMWIGAHPGAPSRRSGDGEGLNALIDADPQGALGEKIAARFGRLPFLLKVLAAQEPLSLQVHPNLEQAAAGFADEQANGPELSSPQRNYRDDQHKPEMIVALTPFEALSGFRNTEAAALAFDWLASHVTEQSAVEAAQTIAEALRAGDLAPAVALILQADDGVRRLAFLGARAVDAEPEAALAADASLGLLPRLAGFHPGDTGTLLALLLNLVSLQPGQAMALQAGNIHAYLHGTGIEIMANSDNVLRGGLTTKHVDVPELLRVVRFETLEPQMVQPQELGDGAELYASGFEEFDLLRLSHSAEPARLPAHGPSAVIVTSGTLTLSNAAGDHLVLGPGESAFITAADGHVTAEGDERLEAFVGLPAL